jgi:putative ABC transport system ATP-binding protein
VTQNVALPLMLMGRNDPVRVERMLDVVGLAGLGARLPQQLSGGQLQRVAIARALVHRPALLLADEPTGNLDPTTAARVMDVLFAQTREHGASLLLVTHSVAAAARADRVLHLRVDGIYTEARADV